MQSIAELGRRAGILWIWLVVALGCIVGELAPAAPARPRTVRPYAAELRTIKQFGGRLIAVRVQVILA